MNGNSKITESKKLHSVSIECRKRIQISAVDEVISFDDTSVALGTSEGVVSIDGEGLHILKMSVESGEIVVEGKINGFVYIDRSTKRSSIFKRK